MPMKMNLVYVAALLAIAGCAATSAPKPPKHIFETTYRDPDAKPMHLQGTRVVAAVIIRDPAARKRAEDMLAKSITEAGGIGVPMYSISMETAVTQEGESKTRAAVEAAGAQGLVVMKPVDVNHRSTETLS